MPNGEDRPAPGNAGYEAGNAVEGLEPHPRNGVARVGAVGYVESTTWI